MPVVTDSPILYGLGSSALVFSEQVVVSGLPSEGALISISELQTPELGTSHFGFKINEESNFYGFNTTNRLVYNGDKIKFKALPSNILIKNYEWDIKLAVCMKASGVLPQWQTLEPSRNLILKTLVMLKIK